MRDVNAIKKKLDEIESLLTKTESAVFIANEPFGKVIKQFDDLDEAKRECERISRTLGISNASWLIDIPDDDVERYIPKPPFYICIGKIDAQIEEVEK